MAKKEEETHKIELPPEPKAIRFSTILANLEPEEAAKIMVMLEANQDKQPQSRVHLNLMAVEDYIISLGRAKF